MTNKLGRISQRTDRLVNEPILGCTRSGDEGCVYHCANRILYGTLVTTRPIPYLPEVCRMLYGIDIFSCPSDQPERSVQTNPRQQFTTTFDFMLKYTCSKQNNYVKKWKVSNQIILRGLRRLIGDHNLRKCQNVPFCVLQAIYNAVDPRHMIDSLIALCLTPF